MTEIVRRRERQLANILAEVGLTLHEWRALRVIYSFEGEIPMSLLIANSQTDRTALGRTIDRLVRRGWVTRNLDPKDKRAVYVHKNNSADDTFFRAYELVRSFDARLLSGLSEKEKNALLRILANIDGPSAGGTGE